MPVFPRFVRGGHFDAELQKMHFEIRNIFVGFADEKMADCD